MFISQTTDFHFANYRFSFRKLQIFISQTTDSHFANYRFSFRKLQISISQSTDFHFAKYRFPFRKLQIPISQTTDFHFHFVSSHFVSQTTVSLISFFQAWNFQISVSKRCDFVFLSLFLPISKISWFLLLIAKELSGYLSRKERIVYLLCINSCQRGN